MNNFTEGDIFHDRYKLLKYLGGGELSEVWQVHDQLADIEVALKIYVRVGEAGIRQFIKDFTLTESLNHSYILKPHHVDVFDRRPYLILKYCVKGSVSNRIDEGGSEYKPFDEKDIAVFMSQIGGALNYLHQNQILHRDVKPDNVLLGDNGEFLLTDFGISKKVKTTLTKATSSTQAVSFSRPYAPPEILTGSEEPRKDIFSLGVTMFELLTEDLPFEGNGGTMLLMGATVPDLPEKFSPELNEIIKKCMNKEVSLRPTAQDLENYGNTFLKTGKWPVIKNAAKTKGGEPKKQKDDTPSAMDKIGQLGDSISQKISEVSKSVSANLSKKTLPVEVSETEISAKNKGFFATYQTPFFIGVGLVVLIIGGLWYWGSVKNEGSEQASTSNLDSVQVVTPPKENPEPTLSAVSTPEQKFDSLMAQAETSFAIKDFKTAMTLSTEAWNAKNDDRAKQLYSKAQKADKEPQVDVPDNKSYFDRADKEMQNGSLKTALIFYRMACGNKPNRECRIKIDECLSRMNTKAYELIQQGKESVDSNKSRAIDLFKQARDLADTGGFSIPQFNELYQYYMKRADRLYDNEEYQDAKQWYQISQALHNTSEVQHKIQQCNK